MDKKSISENITRYNTEVAKYGATLVAISKTKPIADLMHAYDSGQRDFGENKVQELVEKQEKLPSDIKWHMVGHLQRNKVKYIAGFIHLIHSVDSLKLLKEINKQAAKSDRTIDVLLQVHIATEETKFGFDADEVKDLLNSTEFGTMGHIRITGLMGMATNTDDEGQVKSEFMGLKQLYEELKSMNPGPGVQLSVLSMGMSGDYRIALECGSTMIRIGSGIFGARNYV